MYAFTRTIRKANQVRRYTIRTTEHGWEVEAEQDNRSIRRTYDDWHRVERAKRAFVEELEGLKDSGWIEVRVVTQPTNL